MMSLFIILITLLFIYKYNIKLFVWGFRFINKLDPKHVKLGKYRDMILDIKEDIYSIESSKYPNVDLRVFSPRGNYSKLPVVLFIHGGGWVGGSSKKIRDFTKLLASNNYIVISCDYSLAPEYPYPVSTYQLVDVLNYLYDNQDNLKIDIDNMFIGGTSAGAHLSSQLGCLITNLDYRKKLNVNLKISKVKGLLLINGVYNLENVHESKFPGIKQFCAAYVGKKNYLNDERIKELSTINHLNDLYPDVFITAGDKDPLKEQSISLVAVLEKNKINCEKIFLTDNLKHDFIYLLNKNSSCKVYEKMISFINSRIKND